MNDSKNIGEELIEDVRKKLQEEHRQKQWTDIDAKIIIAKKKHYCRLRRKHFKDGYLTHSSNLEELQIRYVDLTRMVRLNSSTPWN